MTWKVLFWVLAFILLVAIIGSLMAIGSGGVSCTFNASVWEACLETAFSMLVLRIGVPILIIAGFALLIKEHRKK